MSRGSPRSWLNIQRRRCSHRHCCVGRSRTAGDWSGDCTWHELGLRWFPVPREVISVAVRWYLRYGLSYRDVEELLAERGVTIDHVTVYRWVQRFTCYRWVQRFTCEFISAARPCRHAPGDRWFVDETYLKVAGKWAYLYRAVDQHGQVIDVLLSPRRDLADARASSSGRCAPGRSRSRSPPTARPPTRGSSTS